MCRILLLLALACSPAPALAQFLLSHHTQDVLGPLPADDILIGSLRKDAAKDSSVPPERFVYSGELPLELTGGAYTLQRPDGTEETFMLSSETPSHVIEIIYRPGPFGVFNHDGIWRRTDGMELRHAQDVSATMRLRWPFYQKGRMIPVAPPNISEANRNAARQRLRRDLEDAVEKIREILGGRTLAELSAPARSEVFDLHDSELTLIIDGLAAGGIAEDAVRLYTLADALGADRLTDLPTQMVDAAVAIETRNNVLARGMGALMFKAHQNIIDTKIMPQVVLAMARQGYRPAIVYLLERLPAATLPRDWLATDKLAAFEIVQRYDTPAMRDLAWQVLAAQTEAVVAKVTGNSAAPSPLPIPAAAPTAFLYLASVGADRTALSLPLWDMQSLMIDIAPAMAAPDDLLQLYLQAKREFSYVELARMLCPMLAGRSYDAALLDRVYADYLALANRAQHIRPEWFAASIIDDGLTRCLVSKNRMNRLNGISPDTMWVYPEPWRYAVAGLTQILGPDGSPVRQVYHYLADHAPSTWLDPLLDSAADSEGVTRYRAYRALGNTAFQYDPGPYQGGAIQRMFVQPFKRQSETDRRFFAFGVASLYPQPQPGEDALWVAAGLDVTSSVNGLGGVIGKDAELIAASVADGARAMIDRVQFRNGEIVRDLEYSETQDHSLHVYYLDTTDAAAANGIVDLYLSTKDTSGTSLNNWVISFPLWQSSLGYEQRLASGEMFLQFAE